MNSEHYDVVIVGAGIAGAILAKVLGQKGKRVLILEAGAGIPPSREAYMKSFYLNTLKTPSSAYPPAISPSLPTEELPPPSRLATPRPTIPMLFNRGENGFVTKAQESYLLQKGPLPFASTYERIAGGTTWHWLGTMLRLLPEDLQLKTKYGVGRDWPISYNELQDYYQQAEAEVGVAATKAEQEYMLQDFQQDYEYPMPGITQSLVDHAVQALDGFTSSEEYANESFPLKFQVAPTPQGRNSVPYHDRRTCAGNTNCIPICPIHAKYDATSTLKDALQTGHVTLQPQSVAYKIEVDIETGLVSGIRYKGWSQQIDPNQGEIQEGLAQGTTYILAAHAIETPRLLLLSRSSEFPNGVANSSGQVGRNLMDHVIYLSWGLTKDPVYPYRGPLSTSGIESVREGEFRKYRAAYRIEIGNDGWNWAAGDPTTTFQTLVAGEYDKTINPDCRRYAGPELVKKLNEIYTHQLRLGFLIEQPADPFNRVTLSADYQDGLGLARPEIHYQIDDYSKQGFVSARRIASTLYERMGAQEQTNTNPEITQTFEYEKEKFNFYGAGHIIGTTIMGSSPSDSVVNSQLQSWDHDNLYICGSSVFPAEGTANPTDTIAALAFRLAETL
ncbi:MAG: GMC family oxidoreductase [Symploca sp. SIO1B1]|nr:GMC family oxidoreductase [Symploca sp. SIO1B1]